MSSNLDTKFPTGGNILRFHDILIPTGLITTLKIIKPLFRPLDPWIVLVVNIYLTTRDNPKEMETLP